MKSTKQLLLILMLGIIVNPLSGQWQKTFGPFGWTVYHFAADDSTIFSDGGKIYRSTDKGMTWQSKGEGIWYWDVSSLFISNYGVFAAMYENDNGLLYLSEDNGDNWTQISLSTTSVIAGFAQINSNLFFSTDGDGIFKSTDGGFTWNKILNNIQTINSTCMLSVNETLFLGTLGNGVLKSTDFGESWESCGSAEYFNWVYSLSFSNNTLYASFFDWGGSTGAFRSNDMGNTFIDIGLYIPYNRTAIYAEGSNIYLGTEKGIYRSTNQGASWEVIGLSEASVNSIITLDGNIIIGTRDIGIHTSQNSGTNWINTGFSDWSSIRGITVFEENVIVGCDGQVGVSVSRDNGNTFSEYHNLDQSHINIFVNKDNDIFAGTTPNLTNRGGVYHSPDFGATWNSIGIINKDILSLAIKDNYLFAGSTYDGVFRTTNNGASWNQLNNGLGTLWVSALAFVGENLYAGTNSGIYLSTNYGTSWSFAGMQYKWIKSFCLNNGKLFASIDDGLYSLDTPDLWNQLEIPDFSIFQFIQSYNNLLFAGTSDQLILSENNGLTWRSIFQSPNDAFINSLFVNNDYIYCGTWGEGLWKIKLSDIITDVEEKTASIEFALAQNYPNPFNPNTSIEYSVPRDSKSAWSNVKLIVYDILGNEVAVLVNEQKSAGKYKVNFDAGNLSSGIYFYKINTGDFIQTRKMMLIK